VSFSSDFKGWSGECAASFGMRLFLNGDTYKFFRDVILPTENGTTQIDHIVVSKFGIFVIETKNMTGWIYGRETDTHWTQVLFRNKYRFQNPLRQNYCHTKSLADFLKLDHSIFHSVVFFVRDCRFKTEMPKSVISSGLSSYIKQFTRPCLEETQVVEIVNQINALKMNPHFNCRTHVDALKQRYKTA
jgi:restriction system protein